MSEEMSSSEQSSDLQQLHDCRFPEGLKVLVVETDISYLRELEHLLRSFRYEVTKCHGAHEVLTLLKENESLFDILVADFDTLDTDGFEFLGSVAAATELTLPVALFSGDWDPKLIKTGFVKGACAFLRKPLSMEAMDMLWHLVIRENRPKNSVPESILTVSDFVVTQNKGKRHANHDQDNVTSSAKPRFIWSRERQEMFKEAVEELKLENATPKTIHKYMEERGVRDLTRRNISSHLQKYRSEVKQQQQQQIGVPFQIPTNLPCNPSNSYNPSVLSGLIHNHHNNVVPNAAGLYSSQNDLGVLGFGENPNPNGATLSYPRTMLNPSNNSTITTSVFQNQNRLINHGVLTANHQYHQSLNYNPMMMEPMINDHYPLPYQADQMQQQLLNDAAALNDACYGNFQEDI